MFEVQQPLRTHRGNGHMIRKHSNVIGLNSWVTMSFQVGAEITNLPHLKRTCNVTLEANHGVFPDHVTIPSAPQTYKNEIKVCTYGHKVDGAASDSHSCLQSLFLSIHTLE